MCVVRAANAANGASDNTTAMTPNAAAVALIPRALEHFPERWTPAFRKKMRQIKNN
jgi:hypothetical protein